MTIKAYEQNGKTLYEVIVNIRAKGNSSIRKQKRKRGIETMARASSIEKSLERECIEAIKDVSIEGLKWGEIVDKWYQYKLTSKSRKPIGAETLEDYKRAMEIWTNEIWDVYASRVTRLSIDRIIDSLQDKNKSLNFQRKVKQTINRIYIWGIEEGLILGVKTSPAIGGVESDGSGEKKQPILTKNEIITLLTASETLQNPWFPIWAMAVMTGCRSGELYALTWDDIDFENNLINVSKSFNKRRRQIKCTKAGYWRTVPINDRLRNLLFELKKRNKLEVLPRPRAWTQGYQAKELRAFCASLGITQISFHSLRACFATQLLQNRVPMATVMKICGWKELDTMTRYIRLAGVDEHGATICLNNLSPESAIKHCLPNTDSSHNLASSYQT